MLAAVMLARRLPISILAAVTLALVNAIFETYIPTLVCNAEILTLLNVEETCKLAIFALAAKTLALIKLICIACAAELLVKLIRLESCVAALA